MAKRKKNTTTDDDFELGLLNGRIKYFPYFVGAAAMFSLFFPGIFR